MTRSCNLECRTYTARRSIQILTVHVRRSTTNNEPRNETPASPKSSAHLLITFYPISAPFRPCPRPHFRSDEPKSPDRSRDCPCCVYTTRPPAPSLPKDT
ncbi:hypothetical protein C8Q74DRAFT_1276284 [Fomes fomentarius]|nr:hypothetical protein C8Q74DRAFT_1276284 [Fomes fomentarius]